MIPLQCSTVKGRGVRMNRKEGQMIIFKTEDEKISVDVRMDNETVWLTLNQMATLFERDKSTISKHIKNVFQEGELNRNAVVANHATTTSLFNYKFILLIIIQYG